MADESFDEFRRRIRTKPTMTRLASGDWAAVRLGVIGIGKDSYDAVHDLIMKERLREDLAEGIVKSDEEREKSAQNLACVPVALRVLFGD